jgi:transposase
MDYFVGIDWASDHHDIDVIDKEGDKVRAFQVKHSVEGIQQLCDILKKLVQGDPARLAIVIETSHGLLVSALIDEGFTVYHVNPRESERRRKSSGAKTDSIDAHNLAKLLRSEIKDMKPVKPSSETIAELRQLTRDQNGLIQTLTALDNQLRACLLDYFPAFIGMFTDLDSPISLAFLRRYPTLEKALKLSVERLAEFLRTHRHPYPNAMAQKIHAKLREPQLTAKPHVMRTKSRLALVLVEQIQALKKQIVSYDKEITALFQSHSDRVIFASLPGAGKRLAPRLLAEWGDDRTRFDSSQDVGALAGTSPTPYQSGKLSVPRFRWSCVKDFRYAMQLFAWESTFSEPWAREYYDTLCKRGKKHHEAVRALANIWVRIIFAMWKNHQPYNRDAFLAAQNLHRRRIA